MPLPFDATVKELARAYLPDWQSAFGLGGPAPLSLINVDLSTITAATDLVVGAGDPLAFLYDLNFQAGRDPELARRVLAYNALLYLRYGVPVHSVVVLLRPAADDPGLTGTVRYGTDRRRLEFHFDVVRLWQRPAEEFLVGGLGTLPLATLGRLPEGLSVEDALPEIIRRMEERLTREAAPADAARLLTAAWVLTGLRVSRALAQKLYEGVRAMEESVTYQMIVEEGEIKALQRTLLRQGLKRFGPPDEATRSALTGIGDLERLGRMTDRLLDVGSWAELLSTP
jgi:hypothetical protein